MLFWCGNFINNSNLWRFFNKTNYFPTPSLICLPIYLKIKVIFVTLIGGLVPYEISKMTLGLLNYFLFVF